MSNNYKLKYKLLRRKCEELRRLNERTLYRLNMARRISSELRRERRGLIRRLDEHNDSFRESEVPAFWEENAVYQLMLRYPDGMPGMYNHLVQPCHNSITSCLDDAASLDAAGALQSAAQAAPSKAKDKDKEGNYLKKPKNAYFLFSMEKQDTVRAEYFKEQGKEISRMELTKRIAAIWKQQTPEEKKVYYDRYEKDKLAYEKDKLALESAGRDSAAAAPT